MRLFKRNIKLLERKMKHKLKWKCAKYNFELLCKDDKSTFSPRAEIYYCEKCKNELFIAPDENNVKSISIGYNKVLRKDELYLQWLNCDQWIIKSIIE